MKLGMANRRKVMNKKGRKQMATIYEHAPYN